MVMINEGSVELHRIHCLSFIYLCIQVNETKAPLERLVLAT